MCEPLNDTGLTREKTGLAGLGVGSSPPIGVRLETKSVNKVHEMVERAKGHTSSI